MNQFVSETAAPLSFAQERMWFLWRLDPSNASYHLPMVWRCRGKLDCEGLQWALNEVVCRHEILRTVFGEENGIARQFVKQGLEVKIPTIVLREEEIQEFCWRQASKPFDLEHEPGIRGVLIRVANEHHVLELVFHHIVADSWSLGIFLKETVHFYRDFVRGESRALKSLPSQYRQYAAEQRAAESRDESDQPFAYWKEQLGGGEPLLELPTDRIRPDVSSYQGKKYPIAIPAETLKHAQDLGRRESATLFMLLLASFQLTLARWSGQEQAIAGTAVANRPRPEHEELIGLFVNTLVLRVDFSGDPSVRQLLARVRTVCLAAFSRQDYPFERLVQELNPGRDLARNPLFQVMFTLQNAPMPSVQIAGLVLDWIPLETGTSQLDLSLSLWEESDGLEGWLEYNTELFEEETIRRISTHFRQLFKEMVVNPNRSISMLEMLNPAERELILVGWNQTQNLRGEFVAVHRLFEEQVKRTPDAAAIAFRDRHLTYRELHLLANRLAHCLHDQGVRQEDLVGICMHRCPEMIVAVLAIMKAGAACVPLDPEYPRERVGFIVKDARMPVVLSHRDLLQGAPWDSLIVDVQTLIDSSEGDQAGVSAEVSSDNAAYVIYTSGSTGWPKGVVMTHGPLSNLIQWQLVNFSVPCRKTLQFATLNFDVAFQEIFSALCSGGELVLIEEQERSDLEMLLQWCNYSGVERLFLPFIALEHMARAPDLVGSTKRSSLKVVITAGEQLQVTPAIREMFNQLSSGPTLVNQYGPSETHVVTFKVLEGKPENWPTLPPIGTPIANTRAYVLDGALNPVPAGVAGELYLGGCSLARGYLNCPDLTAERFIPDLYGDVGGKRLYRTGDRARWMRSGELEYLGRVDEQVKVRGYRIEPGEIEAALRAHPGVADAVVAVQGNGPDDKRLRAYIVPRPNAPGLDDLKGYLRRRLPQYMIPGSFVTVEELPLTPSGKVNRRALPTLVGKKKESRRRYIAPHTPVERTLCEVCAQLLGLKRVGMEDNFFELGGDSILSLQFIARARAAGLLISVKQIFLYQNLAGLAAHVRCEESERIPCRYHGGWTDLSYAQEGLWLTSQIEPENSLYNIGSAIHLRGRLDVRALEESLNEVISRHQVFRTAFKVVDGRPMQRVIPWSKVPLQPSILPACENGMPNTVLDVAIEASRIEIAKAFTLQEGRPLRAALFSLGAEEHVLAVSMHHIVADAWTINLIIKEVGAFYEAFSHGRELHLPEPSIQYADFSLWQREPSSRTAFDQRLAAWVEELRDVSPLELPLDHPRPPTLSHRGATVPFAIEEDLCNRLRDFAFRENATLHMVLLTAFVVLLRRYSGQTDVTVGVPVMGRNREELEQVAGLFVNTVPVRVDVSGDPVYSELLQRVKKASVDALAREDIPFEKLVEALHLRRALSRSPLFQVMFSLHSASPGALSFPGLIVQALPVDAKTAKSELSMEMVDLGKTIDGAVEYSTDLFHSSSAVHIAEHFIAVLEEGVARPCLSISSFNLESIRTSGITNVLRKAATFDFAAWPAAE
jgi:amino acid adenylation domain-containing protein